MKKIILLIILFNFFAALAYTQVCPGLAVNPAGTTNLTNCKPLVLQAAAGFAEKTAPPVALALSVGFVIDNKIYVGLGYQDLDEYDNPILLQDMWMFDPSAGTWTATAPFPGDPRIYPFSFSVNGKGYIGGGLSGSTSPLADVWEYDPGTDTWTQKSDFASPYAFQLSSFNVNNNAYVIGGDVINASNGLWQYDQVNDAWIAKTGLPGNLRTGVAAFNIGSSAFAGGGADYIYGFVKDFYAYNATTDVWTKIADFPGTPRQSATGFAIGNVGYVGFGSGSTPDTYYNDVWLYNPVGGTWSFATAFTGPDRVWPLVLATDDQVYATGGVSIAGGGTLADIWAYNPADLMDSYLWTTADGSLPTNVATQAVEVTTPGTYTVTASKSGCSNVSSYVVVAPAATVTAIDPTGADINTPVQISGENFYTVTGVLIGGTPAQEWSLVDNATIIAYPSSGAFNDSVGVVSGCDTAWISGFIPACTTGNWNGHIDNNWHNPANWCGGVIPGATDDVFIGYGANHYPVLSTAVQVNGVVVDADAKLTIAAGGILKLTGDLDNFYNNEPIDAYNGKIVFNGTNGQTIYGDLDVKDLELDNPNDAEIDFSGYTYVYGTYTPTQGVLHTNDGLVLASTTDGTARVAAPNPANYGAADTYIDGYVEVDRLIPPKRAWRMLTAPLYDAGSIYDNWQNGGSTCTCGGKAGAEIFGPVANDDNGLTPNNNPGSAYSMRSYLNQEDRWGNVESTKDSLLSVDGATSAANKAYAIFITGPYGSNHISSGADTTTLRAFGYLQQGDQTFTFEPNEPGQTGAYRLIGNPYASPIDLKGISGVNTKAIYWIWDPKRAGDYGVGGYVSFSYDTEDGTWDQDVTGITSQTLNLQSGAAFFVEAEDIAQPVEVTIAESNKTDVVTNDVFFAPVTGNAKQLRVTLNRSINNQLTPIDGVLAKFGNNYKKGVSDDVNKLFNYDENVSVKAGNDYLAISRQPLPVEGDTIHLYTYALKAKTGYGFTVTPQNLGNITDVKAWLVDGYLKTKTQLSLAEATTVAFTTTSAAASRDTSRFIIVFAKAGALASINTNVKAWQQDNNVQVQWQTTGEQDVQQYVIERSANGQNFTALPANVTPRNTGKTEAYTVTDNQPATGDNLYRILAASKDGSRSYSNIARVTVSKGAALVISPNPVVKTARLNVTMTNMAAGRYTIQLFSTDGKKIMQRVVQYNGTTATQVINVPAGIATGSYRLVLQDDKGNNWKQQVVVQ